MEAQEIKLCVKKTTVHNAPFDDWSKSSLVFMSQQEFDQLQQPEAEIEKEFENGELVVSNPEDLEWVTVYKILGTESECEIKLESLWQNTKTGEIYQIVGFGKSANNATHGQQEVYYKNLETQELYNCSIIEFLEKFESADMTTKVCRKCLSMQMAKFRDLNEKVCLCCGERVDWRLSDGQKRLL